LYLAIPFINFLKTIIHILGKYVDLFAILIFVLILEFSILVLLLTRRMKQVKAFSGTISSYSRLYEIVVFPVFIILGFMLILIKHFILFASYDASMNFVGLEPLLSLVVIALMVYLILLVLKHEVKVKSHFTFFNSIWYSVCS